MVTGLDERARSVATSGHRRPVARPGEQPSASHNCTARSQQPPHEVRAKANPAKAGDAKLRGYRPPHPCEGATPVGPPNSLSRRFCASTRLPRCARPRRNRPPTRGVKTRAAPARSPPPPGVSPADVARPAVAPGSAGPSPPPSTRAVPRRLRRRQDRRLEGDPLVVPRRAEPAVDVHLRPGAPRLRDKCLDVAGAAPRTACSSSSGSATAGRTSAGSRAATASSAASAASASTSPGARAADGTAIVPLHLPRRGEPAVERGRQLVAQPRRPRRPRPRRRPLRPRRRSRRTAPERCSPSWVRCRRWATWRRSAAPSRSTRRTSARTSRATGSSRARRGTRRTTTTGR
jgi:hypothetical protein